MRIEIDRKTKIALLQALKDGYLETDNIPELKCRILDDSDPFEMMRKINGIEDEKVINILNK